MTEQMTDLHKLLPLELLQLANAAGISVTVDCQCPGIFIDGRHEDEERPAHIPADLWAALTGRSGELVLLLEQAGWWSCGCEHEVEEEDLYDPDRYPDGLSGPTHLDKPRGHC
jgi:hypothetical protein